MPGIVFGARNKLRPEGPFLDLIRKFRDDLNACDLLTIVGYSFRDHHVNHYLGGWLNADHSRRVRIISPQWPGTAREWSPSPPGFIQYLQQVPGRVQFIPATAKEAL